MQTTFGRVACAEQSVQQTLDACTAENVRQMEQAVETIYLQHSQVSQHNYEHDWQLLDVDMSGVLCGKKAAFATKGFFAKQSNRRRRQLGRVVATHYDEVVIDHLFEGQIQLTKALRSCWGLLRPPCNLMKRNAHAQLYALMRGRKPGRCEPAA